MSRIIILKGLPASGKSTWAKAQVNDTTIRVNRDDLRTMMNNGVWSKQNEKLVVSVRDAIIWEALNQGRNVIVDDTNLNPHNETFLRIWFRDAATVEVKVFDTPLEECLKRNALRTGAAQVPSKVIVDMDKGWKR